MFGDICELSLERARQSTPRRGGRTGRWSVWNSDAASLPSVSQGTAKHSLNTLTDTCTDKFESRVLNDRRESNLGIHAPSGRR